MRRCAVCRQPITGPAHWTLGSLTCQPCWDEEVPPWLVTGRDVKRDGMMTLVEREEAA